MYIYSDKKYVLFTSMLVVSNPEFLGKGFEMAELFTVKLFFWSRYVGIYIMFLPGLYSVTSKIMLLFVYMFLNNGKDDKGLHHKDILCLCRPVTYINTMDKNSYGRPYKVIYVLSTP